MEKKLTVGRPHATCLRTRLVENPIAAVDYCQCGHMHLHLGPFSMRLTPEAISGLIEALGQAIAAHAAMAHGTPVFPARTPSFRRGGDA